MTRNPKKRGYRIVKYAAYRAMPWRNGRGSTLEIAREPASGDDFAWRLSLADIDQDGDFSSYPGYSRALVLIAGESLQLRFRGHGHCPLSPKKRGTRFEGDWKTRCTIPAGRCTDLSLIVRKEPAGRRASVVRAPRVVHLESTRPLVLSRDLYGALFVLAGSVAVTESARARARARARIVRAQDTLLLSPGPRQLLTLRNCARSPAQVVILRWGAAT